ncbi:MAG: hypothetical protein IKX48_10140 [Victivallales bacterium]|nr:hypothetical protein [Victivallales bacterium]
MINVKKLLPINYNNLAKVYAEAYDLPMTAGSDAHNFGDIRDFVVGTETPIESVADYIECIKQGSLQLPCLSLKLKA